MEARTSSIWTCILLLHHCSILPRHSQQWLTSCQAEKCTYKPNYGAGSWRPVRIWRCLPGGSCIRSCKLHCTTSMATGAAACKPACPPPGTHGRDDDDDDARSLQRDHPSCVKRADTGSMPVVCAVQGLAKCRPGCATSDMQPKQRYSRPQRTRAPLLFCYTRWWCWSPSCYLSGLKRQRNRNRDQWSSHRWSTWLKPAGPLVLVLPHTPADVLRPTTIQTRLLLSYLAIDAHHMICPNLRETVSMACYLLIFLLRMKKKSPPPPPPLWSQHQQQPAPVQWSSDGRWWWCWEPRPPPHAARMSSLVSSSAGSSTTTAVLQTCSQPWPQETIM